MLPLQYLVSCIKKIKNVGSCIRGDDDGKDIL